MTPKDQARALLKAFETGEQAPFEAIHPQKYIQHNLSAEDGPDGLKRMLASIPQNSIRVRTARVFQDGDYVVTHNEYEFFGPKVGFDIYRFEDGKIVEHWDNLQEIPPKPNPSGHTMIDGPTEVKNLEKTEQNKELIRQYLDDISSGRMDRLPTYFEGDQYIQHNPQIADGLSGLMKGIQEMTKAGITVSYDRVHKVLGEGNFVLAVSEGEFAGKPTSFYDLFRIENGKIVEHWDILETIPPRAEWKNNNGKFGFQ
ncbi:MAG TPA: nuclear transport factor 2 family protein [Candidatus Kapabacteria bacterium]|nr:nuclear transport factor 2 family protein [Candidatus Kapabacteria bacterium]